jgi:hypothetical protein
MDFCLMGIPEMTDDIVAVDQVPGLRTGLGIETEDIAFPPPGQPTSQLGLAGSRFAGEQEGE